jgi:hypothetical protein
MMILLTLDEANEVKGPSDPMHALYPTELKDGNYVLPVAVLHDPAHAIHHDFLVMLPQIEDPPLSDYAGSTGATGSAGV